MANVEAFAALFSGDKAYKRWFANWWRADFSADGHNRSVPRTTFAGREWAHGWAPPHDLDGNPNPAFTTLDVLATRQHWWPIVHSNLSGAFLSGTLSGHLRNVSGSLDYCAFVDEVALEVNASDFSACNALFLDNFSISGLRNAESTSFRSIYALSGVRIISGRSVTHNFDSARIRGALAVAGNDTTTRADALIAGSIDVAGSLIAKGLRSGDVTLRQTSADTVSEIDIRQGRTKTITIRGRYSNISLAAVRAADISIAASEVSAFSGPRLRSGTVSLSGNIGALDLTGSRISSLTIAKATKSIHAALDTSEVQDGISIDSFICKSFSMSACKVGGGVKVSNSRFDDLFDVSRTHFEGPVSLSRSAFTGLVRAADATFGAGLDLKVGSGADVANDASYSHIGEADFSGSHFAPDASEVCLDFDGRQTRAAANFEGATFLGIPAFYGCHFHENVSFRGANFDLAKTETPLLEQLKLVDWQLPGHLEPRQPWSLPGHFGRQIAWVFGRFARLMRDRRSQRNLRLARYERAYNALRQRAEEVGNAKYERLFHTYELRVRRRRTDPDSSLLERVLSYAYDATSAYGQSIGRPLAIIFFLAWAAPTVVYFFTAGQLTVDGATEAAIFSARQVVKPFSVWGRDFLLQAGISEEPSSIGSWLSALVRAHQSEELLMAALVRLIATLQSLATIAMLFLSGLAIRRSFGLN